MPHRSPLLLRLLLFQRLDLAESRALLPGQATFIACKWISSLPWRMSWSCTPVSLFDFCTSMTTVGLSASDSIARSKEWFPGLVFLPVPLSLEPVRPRELLLALVPAGRPHHQ